MWGNPKLVQWDYGKEINITLEDALMSLESLRFMLGGAIKKSGANSKVLVRHTAEVVVNADGTVPAPKKDDGSYYEITASTAHPIKLINLGGGVDPSTGEPSDCAGTRTQITANKTMTGASNTITFSNTKAGVVAKAPVSGDHIRIFWEEEVENEEEAVEVTISPDTFPGTYRVVGDTFMRSEKTGKDEPFQFVINKAKVQSNVTLTLQAEGDPTTNTFLKSQKSNVVVKMCELRETPKSFNYQTMAAMYIAA